MGLVLNLHCIQFLGAGIWGLIIDVFFMIRVCYLCFPCHYTIQICSYRNILQMTEFMDFNFYETLFLY